MKWHNFNLSIRIKISSGASLVLYILSVYGILILSKWLPAVGTNIIGILSTVTIGEGAYLTQQHGSNKLDVDAAKANAGANLDQIKLAAQGGEPCPGVK